MPCSQLPRLLIHLAFYMTAVFAPGTASAAPQKGDVNKTAEPAVVAASVPAPIKKIIESGRNVEIVDSFAVDATGLTAWVLSTAGERRIYYVPKDGSVAIYGLMFDRDLGNVTRDHMARYNQDRITESAKKPSTSAAGFRVGAQVDAMMGMLRSAHVSHVEGNGQDVWIIYDPVCSHCHNLWRNTRELLDTLRIHWVPVNVLGRSDLFVEAIFSASNPAVAMAAATEHKLEPAKQVSAKTQQALKTNGLVIAAADDRSRVPYIVFRNKGQAAAFLGTPNSEEMELITGIKGASTNGKR